MTIEFADIKLILSRFIFYLFQGFIFGLCYFIIPGSGNIYSFEKLLFVGSFATFILICIDTIVPEVGVFARYGTGLLVSSISNY